MPVAALSGYGSVAIAFTVDAVFDVEGEPGTYTLTERAVEPYRKDYDELEPPASWARRFDISRWGRLEATDDGETVGRALIAVDTPRLHMLEGRDDLAVLWDIRVRPDHRGKGVGSELFSAVERWSVEHGRTELKIETQNTNVGACNFYAGRGCELRQAHHGAYPTFPGEVQLLWYKALS